MFIDNNPRDNYNVKKSSSIYVAGHTGLVGSAIVRHLTKAGYTNVLTSTRQEMDLRDQTSVNAWFAEMQPEYVFLAAGTVGGIMANSTRPAEFLYDNLMIHANVIEASRRTAVAKLLYLGSSCIYPRLTHQPISEPQLLGGELEPTNEAYALAKIAGIKMCETYRTQYGCNFISAMPTNLYGPQDNFDLESAHVLPALIRKFHEARVRGLDEVTVWGTGSALREFLHVDDLASACEYLMLEYDAARHINVGTGSDISIRELAELVGSIVHPTARLHFDTTKPDGTPRKVLDVSNLEKMGWKATIPLHEGIERTYEWYVSHDSNRVAA